ncbi:ferredoxin [Pseudonocardia pini]|uniref:ferredoxin n=1 Tax=Pseudonocardia pini TaxID=2758030 RepID=UPI0015F10E53|nr:ferredoxin [Pseudonocardia pini]
MRVEVDWARCDGNGACVVEAPEVFDLDDDDALVVLDPEPSTALRDKVSAAASACPKRALTIGG